MQDAVAEIRAEPDNWLERLARMAARPAMASRYLDDAALRRVRTVADASYRRADRELRHRFPQLYPGRENDARI